MSELLWLIPALPLAGALILIITRGNLPRVVAGSVGAGSVGLAAILYVALEMIYRGTHEVLPTVTSMVQ